ncbi:filamentous hemagglutinin N-terminal domain-containing protein [Acinetobacter baumannii]|uniref:two-partner secretion domain-containing protein n=1 Tax=Acinetobacter baumannii TaxID=470 RepID=UPI0005F95C4D|nr:filamentous hemagglutinin N-terminal domain-containing protein [Acinetobacter baumannii]KJX73101.1 ShlA/HecA/FhaA protein [Acinetobacter baumannii]MBF6755122.1 filamentous hemagglutinin N-terminal domain-containing protein [Acinetobacter baumannii]MCO9030794.1 filamentous hemagglutinin N-terminal domain-containing protein [Acinetobacter baumannii]MCO9038669.1 filamentous hemagglutinin N-terminal domain-containing protein [Acinetobacter baumannii]MCO9042354.1 filamentous hemagglutinin N-term
MNKNRYRIIFSHARGMFIAVAEIVKSKTKQAGQSQGTMETGVVTSSVPTIHYKKLNPLNFAVIGCLGALVISLPMSSVAGTQIIADKGAPTSQQPTILNSANGTTQVNIQTPSAGGVSRNTYTQFDVGQEGAILNNSRNNTQTQIGGWVQGNPWLATGEAKVILNEVNSSNPSQLKGYIEVAGKQAQVVIANPSGLICDGCGVINADRFTLTTGQAVMNQGYLESFRVREGQVTIEGKGLNGSLTPYTDIYTRALKVNAGLYANELNTVLGQNDIQVKDQVIPKITATTGPTSTPQPNFALDVGQLGGMYAGKIFLVGTEQGLGVRNAGSINSTQSTLTLNAKGDLVNSGNLIANKDQVQLKAQNIQNTGNISSATSQISVESQNLNNSGLISSADELHLQNQNTITNSGTLNAARIAINSTKLKNSGSIEQTGLQGLDLKSGSMTNLGGKIGIAKSNTGGTGGSTGGSVPTVPTDPSKDGGSLGVVTPVDTTPKTYDTGFIHVSDVLNNDQGAIVANGGVDLDSQNGLDNQGGQLNLGAINIKGNSFNNDQGQLTVKSANIQTSTFTNQQGQLASNSTLNIQTQSANNKGGKIQSIGQLDLAVSGELNNVDGQIASGATVNVNASDLKNQSGVVYSENQAVNIKANKAIDNTEGLIQAKTNLNLNSQSLNNTSGQIVADQIKQKHVTVNNNQGSIAAQQNLNSTAQQFDNTQGQIHAKSIKLQHDQLKNTGSVYADQDLTVTGQNIQNAGTLGAGKNVQISSSTLEHSVGGLIAAGLDREGKLGDAGDVTIRSDQVGLHGQTLAGGNLKVQAQSNIDAAKGQLQAQNIELDSVTGNISTQAGSVVAQNQLKLTSQNLINNQQGLLSSQDLLLTAKQLDNSQGKIQHTGNNEFTLDFVNGLNNKAGEISSNASSINLNTSALNNETGKIIHAGNQQLNITADQLQGAQGQILSNGQLLLKGGQVVLDGATTSANQINISADSLSHQKGQMVQRGTLKLLTLAIKDQLNNQLGFIQSRSGLQLKTTTLNNQGGQLSSALNYDVQLDVAALLDNSQSGKIYAGQNGVIQAGSIDNSLSGLISAQNALTLTSLGIINNQSGKIVANQDVTLTSNGLDNSSGQIGSSQGIVAINAGSGVVNNTSGTLQAEKDLTVTADQINNQSGLMNSQSSLSLSSRKDVNNTSGQIIAKQDVTTHSQGLTNNSGQIGSVQGNVSLDAGLGDLNNQAGKILAAQDLTLSAQNLDNQSGLISAQKKLALKVQKLNNLKGQIQSGDAIEITGQSLNNQGGSIETNADLTLNIKGALDNSQSGKLTGNTTKITAGSINNSNKGQINATDTLTVLSQQAINNQTGVMAANQNVSIQSQGLDNTSGQIGSVQGSLTIDAQKEKLLNTSGSLQAGTSLKITSGDLNNDSGTILALTDNTITSTGDVSNKAGKIASNAHTTVTTQNLTNQAGTIQSGSGSALDLVINGALDNSQAGQLLSGASLNLQVNSLDNSQQGQISAQDALNIISAGLINNQAGTLVANQNVTLSSEGLNNNQGQIGSIQGGLAIDAGDQALTNQSGILQAKTDLTGKALSVDNTAGHFSAQGKIDLTSQQTINNTQGSIIADQNLNIHSQGLINNQGKLATQGNLTVQAGTQALQNQAGMIQSGQDLSVMAASIDNSLSGQINAQGSANLQSTGLLNNETGVLAAGQDLTLNSNGLNNTKGKIGSVSGALNINAGSSLLNNQSGSLQSSGVIDVQAGGVNNQLGKITSLKAINIDSQRQAFNNQQGTISSDLVSISSGLFNNDQGLVQAKTSLVLDTNGQNLMNTNSGIQGGLLSQGNLTLKNLSALDNTQGYIASGQNLDLSANQVINNKGTLLATQNLKLQGTGQKQLLNNQSGQILSMGDMQLTIEQINNQGKLVATDPDSHIMATGQLDLVTQQLDNQNTFTDSTSVQGIDAGNLNLSAQTLNNKSGAIRSNQNAVLKVNGQLSNQSGEISAVKQLNLQGDQLVINNQKGKLLSGENLNITAQSLTGDGQIASLGNANITLKESFKQTQEGQLQANNNLSLSTTSDITNDGKINAGNILKLNAANITNSSNAQIESHDTQIEAQGRINNTGLINGDDTTLKANTVNNQGTGRIYGTDLAISANTLNNLPDIQGKAPVIASRGDMNLGVGVLNNLANTQDYASQALIFSAANLYLGGALDENRKATGQASVVNNESATIESLGNMRLSAAQINNMNKHLVTGLVETSRQDGLEKFCNAWCNFDGTYYDGNWYEDWTKYHYSEITYETKAIESAPSQIKAGGDLDLTNAKVVNDSSQILAGGELKNDGGSITSKSFEGVKRIVDTGTKEIFWKYEGQWTEPFEVSSETTTNVSIGQVADHYELNQTNQDISAVSKSNSAPITNAQTKTTHVNNLTATSNTTFVEQAGVAQNKDLQAAGQTSVKTDVQTSGLNQNSANVQQKDNTTQISVLDQLQGQKASQVSGVSTSDQATAPDQAGTGEQLEIRTINNNNIKVANNALYRTGADSKAGYLIETDPNFTNYNQWLSSDYMLNALGLDPALQQKRLGDGFYEQRMVQDQIANLTGYRFLEGYASDEEQYKALMNNGVTFAKQYGLRPGIALSAAQIAQLTSDIVWLVEKDVTLQDGTKTRALVPQVYVKARVGDLKGDGSLLTGNSVNFKLNGDLLNGSTIAGREAVQITANNINNLMGRIQGNTVDITTKKDLNNIGGQISAKEAMAVKVGGNLKIETTIRTSTTQVGDFGSSTTGVDHVAGLYVGSGNKIQPNKATLMVDVAGNTVLKAAELNNSNGASVINTIGNVDIGTVQTGYKLSTYRDAQNHSTSQKVQDVGSQIASAGSLIVQGQNISGKAIQLSSQAGNIELLAQKDIQLDNGLKQNSVDSKASWKGSFGGKKSSTYNAHETVSQANQLNAGQNIIINSQQGNISATHVLANAGNNIQIHAEQGDVNLLSAIDEKSSSATSSKKNAATYNNRQSGYIDQEVAQTTLKAGNTVDVNAAKNIELQANDVQAGQSIYVGNTQMQRQADGTLKAADGSMMPENVTLSTLETHDQQWDEQQKGYRGIAKELVKGLAVGLSGLEALAPGLKLDKKITVGESNSQRTEQIRQTGTSLNAANIAVGSSGQTTLTSADLTAKNIALSGQKVTLNAAEEQNIESSSHSTETIEGLGVKLNKDSIRLGGFVSEKDKNTLTVTETTRKAGSINTDNLSINGAKGVDILGQNIKATGDTTIDHGRGELNIGGYENKTTTEEKTKNEKTSVEVGVRNAYLDAALAVGAVKDAASTLKDAKDAYSQAQRDYAAGKLTKEALDDSKANVAMATANLASAQIAVGASAAAAAASSATYGFTIGANGERIETTTNSNQTQGHWQGSNLELNNLTLKSEGQNANIQGSRLTATGTTTFNGTKDLNVTAGTEHSTQESSSKTNSQSISYSSGGGGSASIGKQTSQSQSESLTHVNSEVALNRTEGQLNKLNIQGGEVSIADRGNLQVNQIHVESLQDTAKSSNSSKGGSIGAGFGSSGISNVSASYNQSKGSSDSAWVNNTSKLLIGDKDHDANLDAMGVKQVTNIGGVIANATKNADGTLTDYKGLNYSGALELKDIQDHNYNSSRGFNVSTTIGKTTQEKDGQKSKYPNGSTTLGLQSSGQETEQLTKATMGQGTVKNTTELTNRDINTTQEITRDQTTGMLNGSVTVDHRLLSESGRAEIVQQQKDLPENFRQSAENLAKALPDGVYKDKALQTLNNIQAKLYNLPSEYKEVGVVGNSVASELLKRGMESQDVEALFSKLDFFYAAKEFSEIQNQLTDLEKSGVNLETIFKEPKAGGNEQETIYAQGTDFETKVSSQTTLGMTILSNVADLGNSIKDISESTGVDIEKVQLAVGLLISGPVRLVIESGKSMAVDSVVGEKVAQGVDILANSMTAAAHDTSVNTISNWTNPDKISELETSTGENKEASLKFANEVQKDKQGAEYLINAAAGIVVGGIGGTAKTTKSDGKEAGVNSVGIGGATWDTSKPVKTLDKVDNYYINKTDENIIKQIDIDHIAQGHINNSGKAVGFHHEPSGGQAARVTEYTSPPNAQGVYKGQVEVKSNTSNQWITKVDKQGQPNGSTFFPQGWSEARLKYELSEAFKNKPANLRPQEGFTTTTPSGVKVKFVPPSGNISQWRGWPLQ